MTDGAASGPNGGASDGVLASASAAGPYFNYWYQRFPVPSLILVAADFQMLWRNAAAFALLEGPDFLLQGEKVLVTDRAKSAELRQTLAALGPEPQACCHERKDHGDYYVILLQLLAPAGAPRAVAMTFHLSSSPGRYVWADFAPIFGLTPAEASIVKYLMDGARAQSVAEDLSISLDTVRTHIRRIYAKMNVQSREQLFSAVAPFRIG